MSKVIFSESLSCPEGSLTFPSLRLLAPRVFRCGQRAVPDFLEKFETKGELNFAENGTVDPSIRLWRVLCFLPVASLPFRAGRGLSGRFFYHSPGGGRTEGREGTPYYTVKSTQSLVRSIISARTV